MKPQPWTTAEEILLECWYGLETAALLRRRLTKASGINRTESAIKSRAQRLGLHSHTSSGHMTTGDLARYLGIDRHVIQHGCDNGQIKWIGKGKCRLITLEEAERVEREVYPKSRAYSMTTTQAADLLGYTRANVRVLLKAGEIRGYRAGRSWYVDPVHVAELVDRRNGEGFLTWGPGLDGRRAAAKISVRKMRALRKEEAIAL